MTDEITGGGPKCLAVSEGSPMGPDGPSGPARRES